MSVFSRLIVRLLLLCALLCVIVPVLGARQPIPDEAWLKFGFAFCDLPCFAGITPGQTSFDDVPTLLVHHIPVVDPRMINGGASVNFWARIKSQQLSGLAQYDQGRVGDLRLNVLLPVDQIIEHLGTPDCILPNKPDDPDQATVIFWKRGLVSIGAVLAPDQNTINLGAATLALWLRAVVPDDCSLRGAIPWRGFAPLWDYAR